MVWSFLQPSGRLSDIKRNGGHPPRIKQGFVKITHIPCPACLDRDALTTDGRPKIIGGGQLRGASSYVGLTKASIGCEECGGTGWKVPTDLESIDPYALKAHTHTPKAQC